ncbi:cilia- and flagella-associated protein 77-like isoform X2 [Haliotis rufescens]|uniref:cilia- and flagella-associated protein 77-like isoform X2 n=1 Tax=Haliotis rufescens TaxID=6454 RepID=UPI001EAFDC82|nr:cilia- and flagella-associated protein 77-like isoform X2 [Haliotis rufescens]
MAASFDTPYTFTATGDLGIQRDTMLNNELLLRDQLGRPKRRGYLSADGFTFGRPNERRDNSAGDALRGWSGTTSSLPFHHQEKKAERDFMSLNRAAVQAGLVTAPEHYEFRATHDVRRRASGEEKKRTRVRRIPPTMVFGISTRPSTPIFDLLEHKYQDRWQQQRRQQELAKKQEDTKKQRSGAVYSTRASLLKTYQNPVDPAPLWQMPRFARNAQPHLQTFRSARNRDEAIAHFEHDGISRKGTLGHGVYETAKS